jgi:hypothetical protein
MQPAGPVALHFLALFEQASGLLAGAWIMQFFTTSSDYVLL